MNIVKLMTPSFNKNFLKTALLTLASTFILSTASAEILFDKNYNDNKFIQSDYGPAGNWPTVKNKSLNFYLDRSKSTPYRTEVVLAKRKGHFDFGKEYWLSMDYQYKDWKKDKSAESAPFQIHTTPSTSQAKGCFVLSPGGSHAAAASAPIFMSSKNGQVQIKTYPGKVRWTGPIEKDEWLNIVLHFKLSWDNDGFIEMWKDGKKLFKVTGANSPKWDSCNKRPRQPVFKMGIYKWNWKAGKPATDSTRRELLVDNFKVGTGSPDDVGSEPEKDTKAPSQPGTPKASGITQTTINLNWSASTDNVAVQSYEVHYTSKVKTVSGTSTTLTGLTPNVNYSIKVRAVDAAGNKSAFSDYETAVTDALPSNTTLIANAGVDKPFRCVTQYRTVGSPLTSDGATYRWTTTNGHILADASKKIARVDKAGTYKLTVSKTGSETVSDTVLITQEQGCNTDPKPVVKVTLSYQAGTGGRLTGTTNQAINKGTSGTAVTAVANAGYTFVKWSDGKTTPTRTDSNVSANKTLTAQFKKDEAITPPSLPDYDQDGITDNTDIDDDNDGFTDAEERAAGTNPLDANSKPATDNETTDDSTNNNTDTTNEEKSEKSSAGSFNPLGLLVFGLLALMRRRRQ